MSGVQKIEVTPDEDGMRVDRWFKNRFPSLNHGQLQKILRKGDIRVDSKRVKANGRLEAGQTVRVPPINDENPARQRDNKRPPREMTLEDGEWIRSLIIYQDEHVIALNKPAGMAVQGGTGTRRHIDGMLEGLKFKKEKKPKLVHRIDKDTSGVLLLARDRKAAQELTRSFATRETLKLYWAVVVGCPRPEKGIVDMKIAKLPGPKGERMVADDEEGKKAQTIYRVLDKAGQKAAWLAMEPLTGRTHQLRVHAADALETPIIGDGKYGGEEAFFGGDNIAKGLHLHARKINIPHPVTGKPLEITAPLPEMMETTLAFLGMKAEKEFDLFSDEIDEAQFHNRDR